MGLKWFSFSNVGGVKKSGFTLLCLIVRKRTEMKLSTIKGKYKRTRKMGPI